MSADSGSSSASTLLYLDCYRGTGMKHGRRSFSDEVESLVRVQIKETAAKSLKLSAV